MLNSSGEIRTTGPDIRRQKVTDNLNVAHITYHIDDGGEY